MIRIEHERTGDTRRIEASRVVYNIRAGAGLGNRHASNCRIKHPQTFRCLHRTIAVVIDPDQPTGGPVTAGTGTGITADTDSCHGTTLDGLGSGQVQGCHQGVGLRGNAIVVHHRQETGHRDTQQYRRHGQRDDQFYQGESVRSNMCVNSVHGTLQLWL